jgi:hypothetical protein
MDLVAYQRAYRQSEIGLGAIIVPEGLKKTKGLGTLAAIIGGGGRGGPVVAPPPVSPYWKPVGAPGAFWAAALMNSAFRAAYNASRETVAQGGHGPLLWRTWAYQGMWYATSRESAGMAPTLYQFVPPQGVAGTGRSPYERLPNAPGHAGHGHDAGTGDIQSRMAAYFDEFGMLDGASLGYDLGMGTLPTLDLTRWGAIPVTPAAADPNWRMVTAGELGRLGAVRGWPEAVSAAEMQGMPIFKFQGSWYKRLPGAQGFQVLGGGSGSGGARYMAGVVRRYALGSTNPTFVVPTAAQWSNNPPGQAVSDAAVAMLTYFQNNGTPYEGTEVTVTGTFQAAYNAEAAVTGLGDSNALLSVDEKYGPNTHDALQSIITAGGSSASAPAVNTTAPGGGTAPAPTPTPTTAPTDYTIPIVVGSVAAGAALIGGSWWLATQRTRSGRRAYA